MKYFILMALLLQLGCAGSEGPAANMVSDTKESFGGGRLLGTVYGSSDSCSTDAIALIVKDGTDCGAVSNARDRSWSIKVNGACVNISDTTVAEACRIVQGEGSGNAVYGSSDSCSGTPLFGVSARTDCENLAAGNDRAWSVKIDGKCVNISDTTAKQACRLVQSEMAGNGGCN